MQEHYVAAYLTTSITHFILAVFVLSRNRKSKLNLTYAFYSLSITFWSSFHALAITRSDAYTALQIWKVAYIGVLFIPVFFVHFVYVFLDINGQKRKLISFAYTLMIFFLLLTLFTPLILPDVKILPSMGYYINPGPLFHPLFAIWIFLALYGLFELFKEYRKAPLGYRKKQLSYFLWPMTVAYIGGAPNFLPTYDIEIPVLMPFGTYLIALYAFFTTYAITRYNLMHIRIVIRKTLIYSASVGCLTGLFVVLVLFMTRAFSSLVGESSFNIIVAAAIIIALVFAPLKARIQSFIDRTFYKTNYDYYSIIQEISHELASTIDIKYIYLFIVNNVFSVLKLERIFLLSAEEGYFEVACSRLSTDESAEMTSIGYPKISTDSELIKLAEDRGGIVSKEMLFDVADADRVVKIEDELKLFEGQCAIPVFIEGMPLYLLIAGEKLSGDAFSDADINLLTTVANQSAVSLKNARNYEDVENLVEERTAELFKTNELMRREIIERKKVEKELEYRAFHDALTELPNRTSFMERLRASIRRRDRIKEYLFAVFFIDVDRFKFINDSLGHLVGDQLLVELARRLKSTVRAIDTVARFGGDEFAVLLEDVKKVDDINIVAGRIYEKLNVPFDLDGREIFVTLSIGITTCETSSYSGPEDLLRDADTALYAAKARGRACHVLFDPGMHTEAVTALTTASELRRAIEHDEFILHYQPILSLKDGSISGFEALVRWQHPEQGVISPAQFLLAAEQMEMIIPIGQWILREACGQMSQWQKRFPAFRETTVSVNLSAREFTQSNFVGIVKEILDETGLRGSSLRLEITEQTIVKNPKAAADIIRSLSDLNIQIDIDDFGTGHSALSYLRYMPINALKIDRCFIKSLKDDRYNKEVVDTIIKLANNFELDVIAEGIETEEQLELIRNMNGGYAQGFLFHKPMGSREAESYLNAHLENNELQNPETTEPVKKELYPLDQSAGSSMQGTEQ